jgi:phage baseplate assembly protein gpV
VLGPVALAVPAQAASAPAAVAVVQGSGHSADKAAKAVKAREKARARALAKAKAKAEALAKADARKRSWFFATGKVTAVDAAAGTITVEVKNGEKALRNTTATITVDPTAKIKLNNTVASLASIPAGAHVGLAGKKTPNGRVAFKVYAVTAR